MNMTWNCLGKDIIKAACTLQIMGGYYKQRRLVAKPNTNMLLLLAPLLLWTLLLVCNTTQTLAVEAHRAERSRFLPTKTYGLQALTQLLC